jgi:hypothetical protein
LDALAATPAARTALYGLALGLFAAASGSIDPRVALAEPTDVSAPTDYVAVLDQAVEAFDRRDYARARVLFEQAHALRPNARVLRGLGLSALQLRRFTLARQELTAALSDTRQPLTPAQREGVAKLLSWMQTDLATLRLSLRPANSQITLDDEPVLASELVMEPGKHSVRAAAEGHEPQTREFELIAGEQRTLDITLMARAIEPAPPIPTVVVAPISRPTPQAVSAPRDPNPPQSSTVLDRWWFWTAVGVVVAGGVAVTVALTAKPTEPGYEQDGLGGVMMPLGRLP